MAIEPATGPAALGESGVQRVGLRRSGDQQQKTPELSVLGILGIAALSTAYAASVCDAERYLDGRFRAQDSIAMLR
jgi:hypothetical protein